MRYFLLIAVLLGAVSFAWSEEETEYNSNEMVGAISFNPSRSGKYDYLKIVQKATFLGGVQTRSDDNPPTDVNIYTNETGAVKLRNATNPIQITNIRPMPKRSGNPNPTSDYKNATDENYETYLKSESGSVIQYITGSQQMKTGDLPALNGDISPISELLSNNTGTDLTVQGGTLDGTGTAFVKTLVGTLSKLTVDGSDGTLITNENQIKIIKSLTLGKVTILSSLLGNNWSWVACPAPHADFQCLVVGN